MIFLFSFCGSLKDANSVLIYMMICFSLILAFFQKSFMPFFCFLGIGTPEAGAAS